MSEMQIFNNPEFGSVRTLEENGAVLFCGTDIARALGYQNPSRDVQRHCKMPVSRCTTDSVGRQQEMLFIPESDLYRMVFGSKLPTAERFTDWVTSEVLPTIRKHGTRKEEIGDHMNDIQIFNYNSNEVRTIQRDGEPWFVLKDVCSILGLGTPSRVADRLDNDEKGMSQIHTPGGNQEMAIINESGLYNVILRSDKPEAKPFRKWVTSDVLPTIRKNGAYMTPETLQAAILNPDYLLQVVTALKDETDKRKALEKKAAEDSPKVLFADAVSTSDSAILIGELAKLIRQNGVEIGQNRLFQWMRDSGYLCAAGERYNMPTQRAMELGLFRVKETAISQPDGSVRVTRTTKVTGKGQQFFINKFLAARGTA